MPVLYPTIAQSGTVTGDIDLRQYALHAIGVPTITSADLFVQGNVDTTSANFWRVQKTQPNTGPVQFATGPGSLYLHALVDIPTLPYLRLEAGIAQSNVRTFTLLVR